MLSRTSRSVNLLVLTALALCALSETTLSAFRARTIKGILFAAASQPAIQLRAPGPEVIRSRYVTVDVAPLLATRSDDVNESTRPILLLNLFDDLAYSAVLDRIDPAGGGLTWVGHIQGVEGSTVTLAYVDGVMSGSIVSPEATYAVRYLGDGVHEVAQIDLTKPGSEAVPIPVGLAGLDAVRAPDIPQQHPTASTAAAGPAAAQATPRRTPGQDIVDASLLRFAGTKIGTGSRITAVTPPQPVRVAGASTPRVATTGQPRLQIPDGSDQADARLGAGIVNRGDLIGGEAQFRATITLATPGAEMALASIPVTPTVYRPGPTSAPVGGFDTPVDATANLNGSMTIAGWAIDDVGIDRVEIWRDPVVGDTATPYEGPGPGRGKIFLAQPALIPGARPDVEAAYAFSPGAHQAGWGYVLSAADTSNPAGSDPLQLYAFAFDQEGHWTAIGRKTIHRDGASDLQRMDAPGTLPVGQGVSAEFWNIECAQVGIDAGSAMAIVGGDSRADAPTRLQGFTPQRRLSVNFIDSRAPANQAQYEGQMPTANRGRIGGIDVSASGSSLSTDVAASSSDPIAFRHRGGEWQFVSPNLNATRVVEIGQEEDVEVRLPMAGAAGYVGYQMVADERRPLPLGSTLDGPSGTFFWQPAAGFLGTFDLEFASEDSTAVRVCVVVGPPMRTVINTPTSGADVSPPFVVTGWAVDLTSDNGSGIDAVHVWAYRLDEDGAAVGPFRGAAGQGQGAIWLGVAAAGPPRPDVGRLYGPTFTDASYHLDIGGLAPGAYDLVVYPHRARTATFDGARAVRINVR